MVACEAGIKTFTPLVSARTPPLMTSTTVPSRISPVSTAFITFSKPAIASSRFLESITVPSTSLTRTTRSSSSSPTLTRSSTLAFGSSVSSASGTYPACLVPMSTEISLGARPVTTAVTFSLLYIVLKDCSSISSKESSSWSFRISLIVLCPSLIIPAGVEAPAVTPTRE